MGAHYGKIPMEIMPVYFVEDPLVTEHSVKLLDRSISNLTSLPDQGKRTGFTLFFDDFYARLAELEALFPQETPVEEALDYCLLEKSNFLAQLLRACLKIPTELVAALPSNRSSKRMKTLRKNLLKETFSEYFSKCPEALTWNHFCHIGFALFKSLEKLDPDYCEDVFTAWQNSYSLLLRMLVFRLVDVSELNHSRHKRTASVTSYHSSISPSSRHSPSTSMFSSMPLPSTPTSSTLQTTSSPPTPRIPTHTATFTANERNVAKIDLPADKRKRWKSEPPAYTPKSTPKSMPVGTPESSRRKSSISSPRQIVRRFSLSASSRTRKLSASLTRRLSFSSESGSNVSPPSLIRRLSESAGARSQKLSNRIEKSFVRRRQQVEQPNRKHPPSPLKPELQRGRSNSVPGDEISLTEFVGELTLAHQRAISEVPKNLNRPKTAPGRIFDTLRRGRRKTFGRRRLPVIKGA